ncbi:hypothetical protein FGIG_10071, partial [Fasciola gigantica]
RLNKRNRKKWRRFSSISCTTPQSEKKVHTIVHNPLSLVIFQAVQHLDPQRKVPDQQQLGLPQKLLMALGT